MLFTKSVFLSYSCADKNLHPVDEPVSAESEAPCLFLSSVNYECNLLIAFPIRSLQSDPPATVRDLFTDIQDGRALMVLLEELSGCKLVRVVPNVGTI